MGQETFKKAMFDVVEVLIKRRLNISEQNKIIQLYNSSTKGSAETKSKDAVEKFTGFELPSKFTIIEKSVSGTLNSLEVLILQMQKEAETLENNG